ncbi:MAG: alpha-N-acetylglucosaminidase N-terminal domain-containing protein, partial [Muribaculaceae bacterium]|nr:alpha-N-acetylglucosaminidase N-terminal domain-containing protein [Muribaculaceae bacterium]
MKKTVIFLISLIFPLLALGARDKATEALLERVAPGSKGRITFELQESTTPDTDFFEITMKDGRPHITGNNSVSVATGLNWYLKHFCGINLTWNNMQTALPDVLPTVTEPVRKETPLTMRYDFNY